MFLNKRLIPKAFFLQEGLESLPSSLLMRMMTIFALTASCCMMMMMMTTMTLKTTTTTMTMTMRLTSSTTTTMTMTMMTTVTMMSMMMRMMIMMMIMMMMMIMTMMMRKIMMMMIMMMILFTERLIPEAYCREEDLESFVLMASCCFSLFHLALLLLTPNIYHVRGKFIRIQENFTRPSNKG